MARTDEALTEREFMKTKRNVEKALWICKVPNHSKSVQEWLDANPWRIVNVSSIRTNCRRYPTQEAAMTDAKRLYEKFIGVEGHDVLVAEMPSL